MNRLFLIVAVLFSFSAIAGPAVAAAVAAVPSTVADAVVDTGPEDYCAEENMQPEVLFRVCPKKLKGTLAVFCQHHMAVMPRADAPPPPRMQPGVMPIVASEPQSMWQGEPQLRPPRNLHAA